MARLSTLRFWGIPPAPFVAVAALAALLGALAFRAMNPPPPIQLAEYAFDTPSGERIRLDALGGQTLLINFWATWCPPCLEELPVLSRFAETQTGEHAVRVIGIALDDPAAVKTFLKAHPLPYPVLIDKAPFGDQLAATTGNRSGALPFSVLIGADGKILGQKLGGFQDASLRAFIAQTGP